MSDTPAPRYRFDTFVVDTRTRQLVRAGGEPIALTGKAFDTLCYLIENRDRIVGKDELFDRVWYGRVVEENNLTQAISALRRAFGAGHGDRRFILTVPGRGYRFVADLDPVGDAPGAVPARPASPPRSRRRALAAGLGVLAALVLVLTIAWRTRQPPPELASADATLAVLPFRPLSVGPNDPLLELGLADTLIARIGSSTTLRVRAPTSSQRFAGTGHDPLAAGRQLGVDYLLEGTTQRQSDQIRVAARLWSLRDGETVWSGTFDERADRIFSLQDRIAEALTKALSVNYAVKRRSSPCEGDNVEAYRAYLSGIYLLHRPSGERTRQALSYLGRAIALDPACAKGYAALSYAYRTLVITGDEDPREYFPLAQAAVDKALAIDPELAEAHASRGFIQFWYGWDWVGAEASLKRAIALNPSLAEARLAYAHLLFNLGRSAEAAAQAREALALDPLSPQVNALASAFLGRVDARAADRALARALELEPGFWVALRVRGSHALAKGDYAAALTDLRRGYAACGRCAQMGNMLGVTLARSGDRDAARMLLQDLQGEDRDGYVPATSMASIHNALGEEDRALDLLERGYRERDVRMTFLDVDPGWRNLRGQPRFQALLRRMRLDPAKLATPVDRSDVSRRGVDGTPAQRR